MSCPSRLVSPCFCARSAMTPQLLGRGAAPTDTALPSAEVPLAPQLLARCKIS